MSNTGQEAGFNLVSIYNGNNKARSDYRLAVCTFKSDKKKTTKELEDDNGLVYPNPDYDPNYKKPDARCVDVPQLKIECTPQIIKDALQQAFEDIQDTIIRSKIVAALEEGKNVINIHDDDVNFEAVATWAAANAAGGKITKDGIEEWFDTDMADVLTLKLANAMQLPDNPDAAASKKLADAVTGYKSVFMTLSAPKSGMSKKVAGQLVKVLELCENKEGRMFKALHTKVSNQLIEKEPELMGL